MGLRWLVANVVTASSSLPRAQECSGDGKLGKLIATFQRGLPDVTSGRLASDFLRFWMAFAATVV